MLVPGIAALVAVIDQSTKQWIRGAFGLHDGVTVVGGFFDLRYVQNTGAAFGVFEGQNHWLSVLSVVVLVLLFRYWRTIVGESRLHRLAMGFMLGGVAGNLLDRIRFGYVIDFLDFYAGRHHFPAFNAADSAICVGVAIYLLVTFIESRRPKVGDAEPSAGKA
jgi:signal peptidase II